MLLLLGIAFLAGAVTAVSPCVLPLLPILLAGGASGSHRRPRAIVAGLAASFFTFTLLAAWVLGSLGLPKDLLRDVGIGLLFLVAATLAVPQLGILLERPLVRLARRPPGDLGGGFALGAALGAVFVPCAGPVLGAIAFNAAKLELGWRTLAVTAAYSLGAAAVMLGFASSGRRVAERTHALRRHARQVRAVLGAVIAAATLAIVFNLDRRAQLVLNDVWTAPLQDLIEDSATARRELAKMVAGGGRSSLPPLRSELASFDGKLADFGPAPDFRGIAHWLNTPEGRPLSLERLRGKVVLIDFWTYSCVNCLRALPHVEAWHRAYRASGLAVVGVHTPEFAFEHELGNVRHQSSELGVSYPVALDNGYSTWDAYSNRYWPAEYLIDVRGHVRYAHFGEGDYERTERVIRLLLSERTSRLPPPVDLPDRTPTGLITPETYLGWRRLDRYAGSPLVRSGEARYQLPPVLGESEIAFGGRWRIGAERAVAGEGARLRLRLVAREVNLVLSGEGSLEVLLDGRRLRRVHVAEPRLYNLVRLREIGEHLLELRLSPGLAGYAFTFG